MPVYEYQCQRCGHVFEKFTITSRVEPGACPACGAHEVRRKVSTFSSKGQSSSAGAGCG